MKAVFQSLCRGGPRILFLLVVAIAMFIGSKFIAGSGLPPELAPILFVSALTAFSLAVGDFLARVHQPGVDATGAAQKAMRVGDIACAVVYASKTLLTIAILFFVVTAARADQPPAAALQYLPMLKAEQLTHWKAMPMPPALGAQVEQETCISLKHRMCWNPRAELKTSREQGLGFGQFTRTWRKDGTQRFDALSEIIALHRTELAALSWANPYSPELQLRAMILKDRDLYTSLPWAHDQKERLAFMLSSYNGGRGGVMSDRSLCEATAGCNPAKWFDNVERTSLKAKMAVQGYGKSFFEINREYVRNVLGPRLARYQSLA